MEKYLNFILAVIVLICFDIIVINFTNCKNIMNYETIDRKKYFI